MTFICSEPLPHNLCFLTTFSPVPLYKTLDVDMWILGRISLLSTISISKRFSAFSPFPFRHLFTPPVLPPPLCLGASSALIPSLPISAFWLIRIYSSSHLSRRKTEREYTSKKLLSHTVQEGDGVLEIKQCSLATRWMRSVCLSPTASLLLLHSLKLCISSVPPPPLLALFFFFSLCYIFSQPWR